MQDTRTLAADIVREICEGPENRMRPGGDEPLWGPPLVGFARGDDPVFQRFKDVVGPFHWTPHEAFRLGFPDIDCRADELGVMVWILPQTDATRADNRRESRFPAERWARSRVFGERFNQLLRAQVSRRLTESGYPACAPGALEAYSSVDSPRYIYASRWSERHAAFAAGLGTFGLCDGLITPVGKSMRAGSVVARMPIPPADRPYTDHRSYCLFHSHGLCGRCIERCPAGALSRDGHDKVRCREYLMGVIRPTFPQRYGFEGYGCGLCQTGVPCEAGIPSPAAVEPSTGRA